MDDKDFNKNPKQALGAFWVKTLKEVIKGRAKVGLEPLFEGLFRKF